MIAAGSIRRAFASTALAVSDSPVKPNRYRIANRPSVSVLISGAIGEGAERDTADEVEAYIKERVPVQ